MVEESRTGRVYKLIEQRSQKLLGKMDTELKGTTPYGVEPVKPKEKLYLFDTMTETDKMQFVSQYGLDAWYKLADEVDTIRRRNRRI